MVDFITICNSACIACIWCILFSVCFPKLSKNLRKVDSSDCCVRRKQIPKYRKARDFPRCVKADSVRARRSRDLSSFERDHEDRREHRSCLREKMCDRTLKEHRNACRCLKKDRKTLPIHDIPVKYSNNCDKSDSSLSRKNSNVILHVDKSEYVCKKS